MLKESCSQWPCFTEEEADAVRKVLLSNRVNYWTGEEGRKFEREFADYVGVGYAIALANGTLALDLAMRALGIGSGDDVVVTPRSFIASVACVVNVGARPVFADVDPDSQNIAAESIRAVLTPKTRAVICVHLGGWPCDMDSIMALAGERGLYVIEDCAQAHGARYRGASVGGIGHIGAWSFCQDKIMSTGGEGGMVTTNDPDLWERMWAYKDNGKSWKAVHEQSHPPGFRWLNETFGSNYRLTEMQSAIGRIQLHRLPDWVAKRNRNSRVLAETMQGFQCLRVPRVPEGLQHACYKFYAFVRPDCLAEGWSRDRIIQELNDKGVPCMHGSCPEVYLEKVFDQTDFRPKERLPNAKKLGETSLMFLVHPTLSDYEIEGWCGSISEVLSLATR